MLLCRTYATKLLSKIPHKYRSKALQQAQQALTEYLHTIQNIPYKFAENIRKHSTVSLSLTISTLKFSASTFPKTVQQHLRYHPVNELDLLFESIGISFNELDVFVPTRKLFLSEDRNTFNVACAVYGFGVPWNKLGVLYKEDMTIFDKDVNELDGVWKGYMELGFTRSCLIGICLVFPRVLHGDGDGEVDKLVNGLKRVVIGFDLVGDVDGEVETWIDVCRKIKLFYDLGCNCRTHDIFEMLGRSKVILVKCSEAVLFEKIEYFCRFDVSVDEVVSLLLSGVKIFDFDMRHEFCVAGVLRDAGMDEERLGFIMSQYPYVFGKNRLANVPHVMRALGLNQWFFDKLNHEGHRLLEGFIIVDSDHDYEESLVRIRSSRVATHTLSKLQFLHSIGFGENGLTIKVLQHLHGTSSQLNKRFNCLLDNGFQFSKLCKIISFSPKILNQQTGILEKKVKFLCSEIGCSLDYLDVFPAYLCFDLEKRIKPRYRFHTWLMESSLCDIEYSLASIIATSERSFIARMYRIHPAAPKKYFEIFMRQGYDSFQ